MNVLKLPMQIDNMDVWVSADVFNKCSMDYINEMVSEMLDDLQKMDFNKVSLTSIQDGSIKQNPMVNAQWVEMDGENVMLAVVPIHDNHKPALWVVTIPKRITDGQHKITNP